ncbi:hypothetical protein ABBQ38_003046 [Trebouxia sp. C0009 RCD-2024]
MGAYLSAPVTHKDHFEGSSVDVIYGGASMQGWRRTMEDAHIATVQLGGAPGAAMFGVFDGHGGSEVAKFCQVYMADELTKSRNYSEGKMHESLVDVFHRMDLMLQDERYLKALSASEDTSNKQQGDGNQNSGPLEKVRQILEIHRARKSSKPGTSSPTLEATAPDASVESTEPVPEGASPAAVAQSQAGCTAVVAVLHGSDLYVANAGDSRAVLSRGGQAYALSEDHKPGQEGERSRIMAAGGFLSNIGGVTRVNGNLNLSRAIGDLKYKTNSGLPANEQIITAEPDVKHVALTAEDSFFVLACDGVWDVMTNQQACDFVSQRIDQKDLKAIAGELLDACLASSPSETHGIGCDNMTAIIIKLKHAAG